MADKKYQLESSSMNKKLFLMAPSKGDKSFNISNNPREIAFHDSPSIYVYTCFHVLGERHNGEKRIFDREGLSKISDHCHISASHGH